MKRLTSFILQNPVIKSSLRVSLMRALMFFLVIVSSITEIHGFSSNSIINTISTNHADINGTLAQLNNPNLNTRYYSGGVTDPVYIQVDINNGGLTQSDAGSLVVYTRRVNTSRFPENGKDNPTAFRVEGLFDSSTEWEPLFNVYFVYRGSYTEEYSSRIPISDIYSGKTGKLTKLRFYIMATNGKVDSDTKHIEMAMNCFDVLKIGANDNYSDTFKDRFHLKTDYRTDLYNYNFRHTQGIFDEVNRVAGWEKISDTEKEQLKNDYKITIPEFELISNSSTKNKPICTLAPGHALQPTHEVEHIMYAMPGDVINLYPYYELYHTDQFYENFSHWYDYKTGGRLKYPDASTDNQWAKDYDMLDFLTEPEKIQISEKNGFFAGYGMAGYSDMKEYKVTTPQEYIDAVKEINTHKEFSYITINAPAGLDFTGYSNVPMLGDGYAFQGIINGNGTTIKNLKYDNQGTEGVGLIGRGGGMVVVKNLILDSSCTFIGKKRVGGIVGYLESGSINISDIKTEAVVYGTVDASDQNAAGILGAADGKCSGLKISNCYIGGTIGSATTRTDCYNAAVCAGWWGASDNLSLKNIVVGCNLIAPDINDGYRYYVRHNGHGAELITLDSGIKSRGGMIFENCYGNLQSTDECWIPLVYTTEVPASGKTKLQNASWNINSMLPPMTDSNTGTGYSNKYSIATVQDYIDAVNEINGDTNKSTSYIELTADLDFKNRTDIPMIGTGSNNFGGRFNGRGHTIRNLFINKSNTENVGLFAWVKTGVVVENLIVDKSCVISGLNYVGLIGRLYNGRVIIQNVKTEATVTANTSNGWGMPYNGSFASAILGCCADGNGNNSLNLKNVYIGGVIGKDGNVNNSVIAPFFQTSASTSESVFENVVIISDVIGVNSTSGRQYISNV